MFTSVSHIRSAYLLMGFVVSIVLFSSLSCTNVNPFAVASLPANFSTSQDQTGFGFHIGPTYGTVAVAYPNGTTKAIARIDGSPQYREMMRRLSLRSSETTHQPYRGINSRNEDWFRHHKRKLRKYYGYPASPDVGTLSEMVASLRERVLLTTGKVVPTAVITIPRLHALYGEDLLDTFEYLGIQNIGFRSYNRFWPLYEPIAVFAGNGLGLCSDYRDIEGCKAEENEMQHIWTLAICYTNGSLNGALADFSSAEAGSQYAEIIDFETGLDDAPEKYFDYFFWERVRTVLGYPIAHSGIERYMMKVLLWGEAVKDDRFRKVLREVVMRQVGREIEWIEGNAVLGGAIGAAELAKRELWRKARGVDMVDEVGEREEI